MMRSASASLAASRGLMATVALWLPKNAEAIRPSPASTVHDRNGQRSIDQIDFLNPVLAERRRSLLRFRELPSRADGDEISV